MPFRGPQMRLKKVGEAGPEGGFVTETNKRAPTD